MQPLAVPAKDHFLFKKSLQMTFGVDFIYENVVCVSLFGEKKHTACTFPVTLRPSTAVQSLLPVLVYSSQTSLSPNVHLSSTCALATVIQKPRQPCYPRRKNGGQVLLPSLFQLSCPSTITGRKPFDDRNTAPCM